MDLATISIKDIFIMIKEMKVSRGIAYLMAKGHRITGILLSLYLIAHIYTLSGLQNPEKFQKEMNLLTHPFFMFLEWCLFVPLAFHAFNGGRLIMFELFYQHKDDQLVGWTLWLTGLSSILMGFLMFLGTESMSAVGFWVPTLCLMIVIFILVWKSVWSTFNIKLWKFQRLTGAALFALALGHYFFMHLNKDVGHHAETILERMNNPFILFIDVVLLSMVTLHSWYGLRTLIYDNLTATSKRNFFIGLLTLIAVIVYGAGIRLLLLTISL